MSEIKVNSIKGTGASSAAITVHTSDGTWSSSTGKLSNIPGNNLIINGSMQINQRGTVTGNTTTSYGGPDRWKAARADAPGTWQLSQVADGPAGFSHCLEHKVTTANSSLDAGDEACITYSFEGQDLTQVKKGTASAEQLTLSFWCKSSTTGTYIVEFYDTDNNRQCSKSFTISAATTWEKKELTFPADTTGAFTYDNNESLAVRIWYAAGTTWTSGTLNTTWAASSDANRAVGCTNLSATLNNYFRLTGVQLEVGDVATEFEHRSYGDELLRCQRYFETSYNPGVTVGSSSNVGGYYECHSSDNGSNVVFSPTYRVTKRAVPTDKFWKDDGTANQWTYSRESGGAGSGVTSFRSSQTHLNGYVDCGATWVPCALHGHWSSEAEL